MKQSVRNFHIPILKALFVGAVGVASVHSSAAPGFSTSYWDFVYYPAPPSLNFTFIQPVLNPYYLKYSAHARALADPPVPFSFFDGRSERAPNSGTTLTRYIVEAIGPGHVLVSGGGTASGGAIGATWIGGRTHADVTGGGGVSWNNGASNVNWRVSLALTNGMVGSSNSSKSVLLEIPPQTFTLMLSDSSSADVEAVSTTVLDGLSQGDGSGKWEISFHPVVVSPSNTLNCSQLNTTGRRVYILIHGWRSSRDTAWITNMEQALKADDPDASVVKFDWRAGADASAAKALNNANDAGRQLAYELLNLKQNLGCGIDFSKIQVIAHSYGAAVANAAGRELANSGYGVVGEATILEMPQQHGLISPDEPVFIRDFDARNFLHVTSLAITDDSLGGFGARISGDNVLNIRMNRLNFALLIPPFTSHEQLALYASHPAPFNFIRHTDVRQTGDFRETVSGVMIEGEIPTARAIETSRGRVYDRDSAQYNVAFVTDHLLNLETHSPSIISHFSSIASNIDYIHFAYKAIKTQNGDTLTFTFGTNVLFTKAFSGQSSNEYGDSGLIDVSFIQGAAADNLTLMLNSAGTNSSSVVVSNPQLVSIAVPLLSSRLANTMKLTWPGAIPNLTLEENSSLAAGNWCAVTNALQYTNTYFVYEVSTAESNRFFRLVKQ
jgi:pimeloyl-ACP methyl ester carboxylesterase